MNSFLAALIAALLMIPAHAVEDVAVDSAPFSWRLFQSAPGLHYRAELDHKTAVEGVHSAVLSALGHSDSVYGSLMQAIDARRLRGQRVRLSARLKTRQAHKAWLWLRADRSDGRDVAYDNMSERALNGTVDWVLQSIVLEIPYDAVVLAYGVGLRGAGQVWLDAVSLETVGREVPLTQLSSLGEPKKPIALESLRSLPENLNFERE